MTSRAGLAAALLALAALAGCSTPSRGPQADSAPPAGEAPATGTAPSDSVTIARLDREARALARTDGCGDAGACRTAPLGHRPCGGPREYLVYCARTTDSVALFRKLDSLQRAEMARNAASGAMGTCDFREPPAVTASGGQCRAR